MDASPSPCVAADATAQIKADPKPATQTEAASAPASAGDAAQAKWSAVGWLRSLEAVLKALAAALVEEGENQLEEMLKLKLESKATTEAKLVERLETVNVVQSLVRALVPELEALHMRKGHGTTLGSKFEGQVELSYSGLNTFHGGLEAILGPPNPKVEETMELEHTGSVDSKLEFEAGNYGVRTSSHAEWLFVLETPTIWAKETKNLEEQHARKPVPLDELLAAMLQRNERLAELREPEITRIEVIGARSCIVQAILSLRY